MGQGKNCRRCVVYNTGVTMAATVASTSALMAEDRRETDTRCDVASQHTAPINIMAMPRMFRTSTRRRSVQGACGYPSTYSCKRNNTPAR